MLTYNSATLVAVALSLLVSFYLMNRFVLAPRREEKAKRRRHAIVDKHCPLQLVRMLQNYRGKDGEVNIPEDIKKFIETYFGRDVVYEAKKAVQYGKIQIYIDSWKSYVGGGGYRIKFLYLAAYFEEGEITDSYFYEPRGGSGKMGL